MSTPIELIRKRRGAAVAMLYDAVAAMPCEDALRAIITVIRDDPRFTVEMLERAGNELGRESHERGRR